MSPRGWQERLEDILEAIERIIQYAQDMDFEQFSGDQKTIDAVIRNLIVIGEGSKHIPEEIQNEAPDVPWEEMRGIRNVVIHEYFGVSLSILWETVQKDVPALLEPLKALVKK